MIAKVPDKRKDAKTSFHDLVTYIGAEKAVDSATGEEVDKAVHVEGRNLLDLNNASIEMQAAADMSARVEDPVYHYIISWPEDEKPTTTQATEAADHSLKALGLEDHQSVIAFHSNTSESHVHVAVNKVNPETGRVRDLKGDYYDLHRALREIELNQGWSHNRGAYEVEDGKVQRRDYDADEKVSIPTKARDFEAYSGEQSFNTWIQLKPAHEVKEALAKKETWPEIHKRLSEYNLELKEKGSGLIVVDIHDPDKLHAKASQMGRFASRSALEKQLGPFEKSEIPVDRIADKKDYKRDTDKRLDRREERKQERDQFYAEFKQARRARDDFRKDVIGKARDKYKDRFKDILKESKEFREKIKLDPNSTPAQKRAMYSINAFETAKLKDELKKEKALEMKQLREQEPAKALTYRDYAMQRAADGHQPAISALRGLKYREGRKESLGENDAAVRGNREADPEFKSSLKYLTPAVNHRNGDVSYKWGDGKEAFKDTGRIVRFSDDKSTASLDAGLQFAASKFNGNVVLTGNDKFKKIAAERCVALGINVNNSEKWLQTHVQQLHLERQMQLPRTRSRSGPDLPGR